VRKIISNFGSVMWDPSPESDVQHRHQHEIDVDIALQKREGSGSRVRECNVCAESLSLELILNLLQAVRILLELVIGVSSIFEGKVMAAPQPRARFLLCTLHLP